MIHKWFHKFIRRRTSPIPEDTAVLWKRRFAIAYGLAAWNAFGLVVYSIYSGKGDWVDYYGLKSDEDKAATPAAQWSKTLNIPHAKVYRISGFKKVDEFEVVHGKEVRPDNNTPIDKEVLADLYEKV